MIRVIVVDDEWYNLEEISDLILRSEGMEVVGKYQNPVLALDEITDTMPDVAFLDIEMPEFDGLTLAERLLEKLPTLSLAFITSWNQYAVQAFDLNAIDYIMKPINTERFERMIGKIRNDVYWRRTSSKPARLKIQCFERFETRIDGIPVKWERSKSEELFAYLLMNHNTYINKNTIIENLWGDYEPRRALQNLQTSLAYYLSFSNTHRS
ncbi:MAG TPA: response regulator [Lachnospiraceae bacterium]|nr:response regulator [Lachnospiraceae bacterium]